MHKVGKWIILALAGAFLLGFLPTVINWCSEFFVWTEHGLGVTQSFNHSLDSLLVTLKGYAWHFTILYALFAAFIIFMEGQNPDRTILWMLVLIFLPVVGVILYLVLGPDLQNIRDKKRFRPAKRYSFDRSPLRGAQPGEYLTGRLLHATSGAELLLHNRVDILINGDETFPAIEEAIKGAEWFIHLEFFIVRDDELSESVCALLKEAVARGVRVRLLYDAVGSWGIKPKFIKGLKDAGISVKCFMPVSLPLFRHKMNFRNHRKIIVVDERVGFTGGLNLGVEYKGMGPLGFWRDTFVRLEGEAVPALHKIFLHDWCVRADETPDAICEELGLHLEEFAARDYSALPKIPLQVVASGIDNVWHSIAKGYFGMITRSHRSVFVTSPYLVPGPELMDALVTASLSGVDVRVMIPATKDHFLVYWGSRSYIDRLLRAGVRVFLYQKGFIHTKSVVADSAIASVGTCNMDVRSLDINFEDQLFIYDERIAREFERQFEKDMRESQELSISEWESRPLWQKMLESFGRLYSAQI